MNASTNQANAREQANVREQIEQRIKRRAERARAAGRKITRTWLGLAGLAFDAGAAALQQIGDLADRAEQRGEQLEADANSSFAEFQDKMAERASRRRARFAARVDRVANEVSERGQQVEDRLKETISGFKPDLAANPVADDQDIEIKMETATEPPLPGYDDLTVPEVGERIAEVNPEALKLVRAYEAGHKNRITVLRQIDDLLAQPQSTETT